MADSRQVWQRRLNLEPPSLSCSKQTKQEEEVGVVILNGFLNFGLIKKTSVRGKGYFLFILLQLMLKDYKQDDLY